MPLPRKAYKVMSVKFGWKFTPEKKSTGFIIGRCLASAETPDLPRCDYRVAIKGPLTTPVGGGIRFLERCPASGADLYVCLRPVRYWLSGHAKSGETSGATDMVIFRENSKDIYAEFEWKADCRR